MRSPGTVNGSRRARRPPHQLSARAGPRPAASCSTSWPASTPIFARYVVTDLLRDGTLTGPNLDLLRRKCGGDQTARWSPAEGSAASTSCAHSPARRASGSETASDIRSTAGNGARGISGCSACASAGKVAVPIDSPEVIAASGCRFAGLSGPWSLGPGRRAHRQTRSPDPSHRLRSTRAVRSRCRGGRICGWFHSIQPAPVRPSSVRHWTMARGNRLTRPSWSLRSRTGPKATGVTSRPMSCTGGEAGCALVVEAGGQLDPGRRGEAVRAEILADLRAR